MYTLDLPLRCFTLTGGRVVMTRACLCAYTFISSHSKTGSPCLPFLAQAAGISRSCLSVCAPHGRCACCLGEPPVCGLCVAGLGLWCFLIALKSLRFGGLATCFIQPAATLLGVLRWPGWDEILSVSCLGALTCAHPLPGGPSSPCRLPLLLVTSFLVLRCQLCCHFSWKPSLS